MATIGWSQERTDEVLVPVIKDMNRRETEGTQSNITRFFQGTIGAGAKTAAQEAREGGSKRMKDAVNRLKGRKKSGRTVEDMGTMSDVGREWAKKNYPVQDRAKAKKPKAKKKSRPAPLSDDDEGPETRDGENDINNDDGSRPVMDGDREGEADDENGTADEDEYREPSSKDGSKRKEKPKIPARQPKRKKARV
jgi:DNA excision repair protein ERCC-5